MTLFTLDSNVVRPFLREDVSVWRRLTQATSAGDAVTLNAISYFETLRGLLAVDAKRQLRLFQEIVDDLGVLELRLPALERAARLHARFRREGTPIADGDLLMGALALDHDAVLVTGNIRHFDRVPGLRIENWLV